HGLPFLRDDLLATAYRASEVVRRLASVARSVVVDALAGAVGGVLVGVGAIAAVDDGHVVILSVEKSILTAMFVRCKPQRSKNRSPGSPILGHGRGEAQHCPAEQGRFVELLAVFLEAFAAHMATTWAPSGACAAVTLNGEHEVRVGQVEAPGSRLVEAVLSDGLRCA